MREWRVSFGVVTVLVCLLGGTPLSFGQAKALQVAPESPASYGTVTGHVYFAGSNLPARFAEH